MVNRSGIIIFLFLLAFSKSIAQTTADYALQVTTTTQLSPARITLSWKPVVGVTSYNIFKKSKTATGWGASIATLTATDSQYIDNTIIVDSAYEYAVEASGGTSPTGYIYAGIKCPAIHNRGILILMVDSMFTDSCAAEIKRLMGDINGDGWQLIRHDVSRNTSDTIVRRLIINDYNGHGNVQALLLLGHIPVPYSGALNPDGHGNHYGAWPADVYYGDVNGTWTDISVIDTGSAIIAANWNAPGDGKWDQTNIPSLVELQVGRVDFYNMPSFAKTEIQMMRSYLLRDHLYKMDSLNIKHRALVDDNFGPFSGEAFAANAWRNFPALIGANNTQSIDFISSLNDSDYLWAYGCGGGSFTSAGGIGSTTNFATNHINGIFTMLFGSYFGDWNVQDNFLRAPLCSDVPALTDCWAGRPNWFFHHMALGESIGYSARLTQNNSIYNPGGYGQQWVHVALMGDPTLRMDYINPVVSVSAHNTSKGANITWAASPDTAVVGYYVYRADSTYGYYQKISPMVSKTVFSFDDTVGKSGNKLYMVRPVKLQQTPSGNYYNLGIGTVITANNVIYEAINHIPVHTFEVVLYPNPVTTKLNLQINCTNNETALLYIIDASGRKIITESEQLTSGQNTVSINVSALTSGAYTVSIKIRNEMQVRKWVKS